MNFYYSSNSLLFQYLLRPKFHSESKYLLLKNVQQMLDYNRAENAEGYSVEQIVRNLV